MEHETPRKLHPLIMVAAVAVTAASLAAIGVMTGVIPARKVQGPDTGIVPVAQAPADPRAAPGAPAEPAPAAVATPDRANPPVTRSDAAKKAAKDPAPAGGPPPAPVAANALPAPPPPMVPPAPPPCRDCGTVESVRDISVKGEGTGLGAVAGGIVGGVLGHQVGSGRGNDLATVAGAVGGAVAGHQIEKQQRKTTRHEITIHMDDGSIRTITTETQPSWRAGDRVKVINGAVAPLM